MRRQPATTGRSAVIWGIASFLALQLGLATAIDNWVPELRDPMYGYRIHHLRRRTLDVSPRPPTVVMLGTSRTELSFMGLRVEEQLTEELGICPVVFNFGISGGGPVTELVMLERLLAQGLRPDFVLIEALPSALAGQTPCLDVHRLTVDRLFLNDLDVVGQYPEAPSELRTRWWEDWPVPWYSHRFAILKQVAPALIAGRFMGDNFDRIDASGWTLMPFVRQSPESYERGVEHARKTYADSFVHFRLGGTGAQALRALLDRCRQEGLAAALVLMPEGTDFRAFYTPEAWGQIHGFLDGLSNEYHVPLINAREWVDDENFVDSHHVTTAGAMEFSDRLGREWIGPFLQAKKK
jgi:hypothetical protein